MKKKRKGSRSARIHVDRKSKRRRDRRAHLKEIQQPAGMKKAAAETAKRRGERLEHQYLIGRFELHGTRVLLACIKADAAYHIHENELTNDATFFARWRTKQAAWQWKQLRPQHNELHLIHLGFLDVVKPAD